ncbi:IS200/IS605 family transposase [Niallia endozanthoxylica]|uniref:IS200/IS605 family transposase n=1 Tax=Niallia endozanthoxylica TaxID=2036016 RepID=A0A5J5HGJ9_9BACI|nr:IS200/IS605 family transposase [Niallia endozanthoxylica]KAA9019976.1 IS200/IS605 family transposase [Niallia endozanthoxylica]
MDYHTKNHSKFLLMCHLIFVCKYRKKLLIQLGNDVKQLMHDIANRYHIRIVEMEVDKEPIHLLIQYEPKMSIPEIVRLLKQMTTFHIWKQHETYLSKHFWKKRTFWSDGYFACSIGNVSRETIQKYIQEQG